MGDKTPERPGEASSLGQLLFRPQNLLELVQLLLPNFALQLPIFAPLRALRRPRPLLRPHTRLGLERAPASLVAPAALVVVLVAVPPSPPPPPPLLSLLVGLPARPLGGRAAVGRARGARG